MANKGRPDYFETFQPKRVVQGEAISRVELIRRLAHYLHVPQRFGYRLMLAFEKVFKDALLHGEGLRIGGAGTLSLERHKNPKYTGFGRTKNRKVLFRYNWKVSMEAKRFLKKISKMDKDGTLNDYFQNPKG